MNATCAHGSELGDAATSGHGRERRTRPLYRVARPDDESSRAFQMRTAGGDVDVRIAGDDVLEVQAPGGAGQYVGADIVAADEVDVVTDIALSGRVAAILRDACVGFEEDDRARGP